MDVVLLTNCNFPFGSAWSSRARHFVKLISSCGYHVHVIAPMPSAVQDDESLNGYDYSVEYVNYKESVFTLMGIGAASPFCNALDSYLKGHKVSFVFSNRMPFVSEHISAIAHKHRLSYILEQCEWFDPSSFKGGKFNPYYRKSERQIRKTNFKIADGIVAISRLFENHYSSLPTIRIPTILDTQQIKWSEGSTNDKKTRLIFAGNIGGRKEVLLPVFEALAMLPNAKDVIHLDLYGPNEQQVLENISNRTDLWNQLNGVVSIHGRIPQQQNEDKLREADYSIFIRPKRRSSDAGFPTKLAESMSVGTPVITNDTGDVGLYIDGANGFLLPDCTSEPLFNVLRNLISQNKEAARQMRQAARKKAEQAFDYRNYIESFHQFLKAIFDNKAII